MVLIHAVIQNTIPNLNTALQNKILINFLIAEVSGSLKRVILNLNYFDISVLFLLINCLRLLCIFEFDIH